MTYLEKQRRIVALAERLYCIREPFGRDDEDSRNVSKCLHSATVFWRICGGILEEAEEYDRRDGIVPVPDFAAENARLREEIATYARTHQDDVDTMHKQADTIAALRAGENFK